MKRRKFMNQLGLGATATLLPASVISFTPSTLAGKPPKKLKFGIVSDVHKDIMPDADARLETFISEAKKRKVDFIIQMGDFCFGEKKNKDFLNLWENFSGPKYHVLGNHDMDKDSKEEIMNFWGMPKSYYSFDLGGYHFIVLDANFLYQDGQFIDYKNANFYVNEKYRAFISDEQIEWFKADLEATSLPTIVFSHQSVWHTVGNRSTIKKLLDTHKQKIICSLNGHSHTDYHETQNGVHYIGINSMSYQWVNGKFESKERFDPALYDQYGNLHHIAGYKDPLYAFATLKPRGLFEIKGVRSDWISPGPHEMNTPDDSEQYGKFIQISDSKVFF
jgi:predicted phosphodiesterase